MQWINKNFFCKVLSLLMVTVLSISLTACGQDSESNQPTQTSQSAADNTEESSNQADNTDSSEAKATGSGNILIAYFSVPMNDGVDTVARASRKESDDGTFGNVRFMANVIQKNGGGELFSIETAEGYPMDNMDDLLEAGYDEKAEDARPELSEHIENLEQYDTVFVGYPNWLAYHNLIQCAKADFGCKLPVIFSFIAMLRSDSAFFDKRHRMPFSMYSKE